MRSILLAVAGLSLLGIACFAGCGKPPAPATRPDTGGVVMLSSVAALISQHPEFGKPIEVKDVPDWAKGRRQALIVMQQGERQSLLFYLKGNAVETVYIEDRNGRRKIWGGYE